MILRGEVERMQDQLDRAFTGEAWHGRPILNVLDDVSAELAAARPIPTAHSIWEIVNHIEAWMSIVHRQVSGTPIETISSDMDWPPPTNVSEESWQETRVHLRSRYQELSTLIGQLSDADLNRTVEGMLRPYSVYEVIHGVIQHSLYHLGQVVILTKASEVS